MLDNLIGGEWQPPLSGAYLRLSHSPGGQLGELPVARSNGDDVAQAFSAARRALFSWQNLRILERESLVLQIQELIDTYRMDSWLSDCLRRGTGCAAPSPRALRVFRRDCLLMLDNAFTGLTLRPPKVLAEPAALSATGIAILLPFRPDTDHSGLFSALIQGATAVVAPLYSCARCSDALDVAKLCAVAGCLPAGVINLVMGLGLEVGVPLLSREGGHEGPSRRLPTRLPGSSQHGAKVGVAQTRSSRSCNLRPINLLERGAENHA